MRIDAALIERFIRISTFEECLRVLPELTREQYDAIRAGKLSLTGDSENLELVAEESEEES